MNFVLIFPLLVLMSMSCRATAGFEAEASNRQIEQSKSAIKVKFIDLPEDVLFIIMEFLDVNDLLNLTELIRPLTPLAVQIFRRRKYRDVLILRGNPKHKSYGPKFSDNDTKCLILTDFEMIVSTLTRFGSGIKRLEVKNDNMVVSKSAIINRAVNDNARDALTYFKMNSIKGDTFEQFTAPFKRIEEVHFEVNTNRVQTGPLPLNGHYPNLRRLSLKLYTKADYDFLDCTFIHLEHLFVSVADKAWEQRNQIEKLLVKNSHIRSIALRFFPADYVKSVAKLLPNLEKLFEIDVGNETVHFENVKDFTIHSSLPRSIENLTFSHLESLLISYSSSVFNSWLQFFRNHPNIRKLEISEFFDDSSMMKEPCLC